MRLLKYSKEYKHEESFYYDIRALKPKNLSLSERAARLIYLNKTCFNGLYRGNKKGEFKVPYGKGNGNFLNEESLRDAGEFLVGTEIVHNGFSALTTNEYIQFSISLNYS